MSSIALCLAFTMTTAAGAPAPGDFPGQWAPPPAVKYPVTNPKGCVKFEGVERVACLEAVAYDWARLSRYRDANAALRPARAGERRVVFMGDSITDAWSQPVAGGFFRGKPYVNRGISGQVTGQMLERFRQDVLELRPQAVVILAGTNDIAGNAGPVSVETVQANLATMAELGRVHRVKVVLASVLPVNDASTKNGRPVVRTIERPPVTIAALNRWLAAYARANGHVFLDYHAAMADEAGLLRAELADDGLHPNAAGYAVMAPLAESAIARALGKP